MSELGMELLIRGGPKSVVGHIDPLPPHPPFQLEILQPRIRIGVGKLVGGVRRVGRGSGLQWACVDDGTDVRDRVGWSDEVDAGLWDGDEAASSRWAGDGGHKGAMYNGWC